MIPFDPMSRSSNAHRVSERALIARITRYCSNSNTAISRGRQDGRDAHELGDYCLIDLRLNAVVGKNIDIEHYGRQIGVLRPFEALSHE